MSSLCVLGAPSKSLAPSLNGSPHTFHLSFRVTFQCDSLRWLEISLDLSAELYKCSENVKESNYLHFLNACSLTNFSSAPQFGWQGLGSLDYTVSLSLKVRRLDGFAALILTNALHS